VFELRDFAGETKPRSVNLQLREGEILGSQVCRRRPDGDAAGVLWVGRGEGWGGGSQWQGAHARATGDAVGQGIGLLSENRKEEGLLLNRSLADNLTITRFGAVSRFGFINKRKQQQVTREWMEQLDIRATSPAQAISELSGGNQQKIAVGRLLHHDAKVLLLTSRPAALMSAAKSRFTSGSAGWRHKAKRSFS